MAMLKNGEADIAYALDGEDALNVKRDPRLSLIPSKHASIYWIEFADQWDSKSVWHDKRVRQAAILAIDRSAVNEARRNAIEPVSDLRGHQAEELGARRRTVTRVRRDEGSEIEHQSEIDAVGPQVRAIELGLRTGRSGECPGGQLGLVDRRVDHPARPDDVGPVQEAVPRVDS